MFIIDSCNKSLLKKTLSILVIAGISLTGCSNEPEQDKTGQAQQQASHEHFQVGTDLDLKSLKALGDAYYQETDVTIDWVPLDKSVFKIAFDEEPPLNFDVDLPDGIDMILMHSAYTLADASASHVLQPIGSELLNSRIPEHYKDVNGQWFGVGKYARSIVYNRQNVNEPELINYAGLGAEKWRGRLCMTDIYSHEDQAIAKMMMSYRGTKLTPDILANWQLNMGSPSASNSEVLSQIEQGRCDVGIVDSDVFWTYAKNNRNTQIRLMWPNQINRGAITNAISIGMIDSGENVGQALRFMEWLVSDRGQALLAFHTSTFPVVDIKDDKVNLQAIRPEWTQFEADATPLSAIIENHSKVEPSKTEAEEPSSQDESQQGNVTQPIL